MIAGDGFRLRRATLDDVDFLVDLLARDDVQAFLRPASAEDLAPAIERSHAEPSETGVFVIEVEREGSWQPAGTCRFDVENRRSRIARLSGLAVHPDFRGARLADRAAGVFTRHLIFDLGFHRLQVEIYGFNERSIAHAERSGFTREGVRRKAYWRHGEWVDGVLFGLIREDLEGVSDAGP